MKVHTFLPLFEGFYNSTYSDALDFAEENIIEYYNEEHNTNLTWSDFDFKIDFISYSKVITNSIINYIEENLPNLIVSYQFEELIHPREYNFSTDTINIALELNKEQLLNLMNENKEMLTQKIKNKYSSCEGFISLHSNNFEVWLEEIKTEGKKYSHKIGAIIGMLLEDDFETECVFNFGEEYNYIDYKPTLK